jgi:hypothetical protein
MCISQVTSKTRCRFAALSTKLSHISRAPLGESSPASMMSTDLYHSETEHFSALPHSSTNEHKRNAVPAELCLWAAASCGTAAMTNALNSRVTLQTIAVPSERSAARSRPHASPLVPGHGLEPRLPHPKCGVLPLDEPGKARHLAIVCAGLFLFAYPKRRR